MTSREGASGMAAWHAFAAETLLAGGAGLSSASDDPRYRIIVGLFVLFGGFLAFRHRQAIGEATGYFVGGRYVTGRTPACIVAAAGVVAMLVGALVAVGSALELLIG
jgi:hypothetical protein